MFGIGDDYDDEHCLAGTQGEAPVATPLEVKLGNGMKQAFLVEKDKLVFDSPKQLVEVDLDLDLYYVQAVEKTGNVSMFFIWATFGKSMGTNEISFLDVKTGDYLDNQKLDLPFAEALWKKWLPNGGKFVLQQATSVGKPTAIDAAAPATTTTTTTTNTPPPPKKEEGSGGLVALAIAGGILWLLSKGK